MSSVLVTGATGQDGSYLVEALLSRGEDVHALVRGESSAEENELPLGAIGHLADLADPAAIRRVVDEVEPTVIVNLGGISSVALSWREPVLTGQISGVSVAALLDAAWGLQERRERDVRFVQASSSEIFGAAVESPQTEKTPLRPVSPYGAAKAYAHSLTEAYRARGLWASAAILYNHESPRRPETFVTRKITAGVARIALGRSDRLELGDRTVRRDWGWAPDYVDALLRMIDGPEPDSYVIATGVAHSVDEFIDAAFRRVGIADWSGFVSTDARLIRPVETAEMRGDATRAAERLGWRPTVGFEEIVGRMVDADLALLESGG